MRATADPMTAHVILGVLVSIINFNQGPNRGQGMRHASGLWQSYSRKIGDHISVRTHSALDKWFVPD